MWNSKKYQLNKMRKQLYNLKNKNVHYIDDTVVIVGESEIED